MTDVINDLFEVTDKVHYIRYNEMVEIALNYNLDINKLCHELCQLKGLN